MVSLTVGEVHGHEEWHLPTYDPSNQNKYHYKLHSVDIYFWTPQDAAEFVNGIRRVLPPAQCEILDEPGPPPRQPEVSAVVQQLERAAIDDYIPTPPSTESQHGPAPTFPGPPISAVPSAGGDVPPPPAPQQFVPMAYNPAAPAAPEQIRHREKTPPPEDGIAKHWLMTPPLLSLPVLRQVASGLSVPEFHPLIFSTRRVLRHLRLHHSTASHPPGLCQQASAPSVVIQADSHSTRLHTPAFPAQLRCPSLKA